MKKEKEYRDILDKEAAMWYQEQERLKKENNPEEAKKAE